MDSTTSSTPYIPTGTEGPTKEYKKPYSMFPKFPLRDSLYQPSSSPPSTSLTEKKLRRMMNDNQQKKWR